MPRVVSETFAAQGWGPIRFAQYGDTLIKHHLILTGCEARGVGSSSDGAPLGSVLAAAAFATSLAAAGHGASGYHVVWGVTPVTLGGTSFSS